MYLWIRLPCDFEISEIISMEWFVHWPSSVSFTLPWTCSTPPSSLQFWCCMKTWKINIWIANLVWQSRFFFLQSSKSKNTENFVLCNICMQTQFKKCFPTANITILLQFYSTAKMVSGKNRFFYPSSARLICKKFKKHKFCIQNKEYLLQDK